MKLAIIDIDGVICASHERFRLARQSLADVLISRAENADIRDVDAIAKDAKDAFWRTAFDPGMSELDAPLPGVEDAFFALMRAGYHILFLSSRVEAVRDATVEWFWENVPRFNGYISADRIYLKPKAFQYVKTAMWKAGTAQMIVARAADRIDHVLFIDDDPDNRAAVQEYEPEWQVAASLDEAVALVEGQNNV